MSQYRPEEGLTSQDHENRDWRPIEVALMAIALLVFLGCLFLCFGSLQWGWNAFIGF